MNLQFATIKTKPTNKKKMLFKTFRTQYVQYFKKITASVLISIVVCSTSFAQNLVRPFILASPSDREAILTKIETQQWAKSIYLEFIRKLDLDIQLHQSNPDEFLRGLPFDWENGKPGETPPFYKTFHSVNGEQRNLDNATDMEWANGKKLLKYLQLGVDCGMAYYLTEDEKYAQCAIDILNAFVNGVLQSEVSDWRGRGGWLFPYDGFREVREIGSKVPLIYDFTASFIKSGGQAYDLIRKKKTEFPQEKAQAVFRTYADITVNYGQTGSNHPILEAPGLVYNALAIDDAAERNKLLSYFLVENTENQDALNVMAAIYKNEGDIWPETSQYLNAAGSILTRLMRIVNKYDPSLHLGEKYSNVLFSLPALDYLVYPNNQIIRWGDGKRIGTPSYSSYEDAYLLGKMDGLGKITNKFGPLLNKAFKEGKYKRSGMNAVLWYDGYYAGDMKSVILPRTDKVDHAGIFLQRNLSSTGNPEDGLMCFVGGAHMVHGHAEGMNIELYGKGQVLGVDNGRGSYQQDIHENYSRIFAAHNTVIVNGNSRGDSGWVNLGINTVKLISMEPTPRKEAVSPYYSFTQTSFVDDKGDLSEAVQERALALIRTSETTGYYVDVFRSKSKLSNEYHDYLYHNIGDKLEFLNSELELSPTPERYRANANLPWVQNGQYRHPGWHFFEDVQTSSQYEKDVKVRFSLEKFERPIYMDLYIPGFENREYTKVLAPKTFEAPEPYDELPTPTLVIRKTGEAWNNPFVVVYEPFIGEKDNNSVVSVEKLIQNGKYKGVKVVSEIDGEKLVQYIITQASNDKFEDKNLGINFSGTFAVVTGNKKGEPLNLYMGDGKELNYGNVFIKSEVENAGAFLDLTGKKPVFKSNKKEKVYYEILKK